MPRSPCCGRRSTRIRPSLPSHPLPERWRRGRGWRGQRHDTERQRIEHALLDRYPHAGSAHVACRPDCRRQPPARPPPSPLPLTQPSAQLPQQQGLRTGGGSMLQPLSPAFPRSCWERRLHPCTAQSGMTRRSHRPGRLCLRQQRLHRTDTASTPRQQLRPWEGSCHCLAFGSGESCIGTFRLRNGAAPSSLRLGPFLAGQFLRAAVRKAPDGAQLGQLTRR